MAEERPIVNIVGGLVALGPYRRDLLATYQRWFNDFATLRTLAHTPQPMTFEAEAVWYDDVARNNPTFAGYTIFERATARPIGVANWHGIDYRHRTAEYGLAIGEAAARGKGYATEATRLMLDYAFTALGLHNCLLTVYEYNLAAHRVYTKVGFREFGRRRECHSMGGRLWDEIYMDCLATEFVSPVLAHVLKPDQPRG